MFPFAGLQAPTKRFTGARTAGRGRGQHRTGQGSGGGGTRQGREGKDVLGKGRTGRGSVVCVGKTNKDVDRDTGSRYSGICRRALQRHSLAYTSPLVS